MDHLCTAVSPSSLAVHPELGSSVVMYTMYNTLRPLVMPSLPLETL